MAPSDGFPRGARYTPVPSAILGPLLQEIPSLAELKCTLRVLGLVHQRRSRRLWLTMEELISDPVLLNGLGQETEGAASAILRGIRQATDRGSLLLQGEGDPQSLVFVNDEPGRQALTRIQAEGKPQVMPEASSREPDLERPNIFPLYEENIGPVGPILAEELEEAERTYPWPWIQEAFREAVRLNRRNWKYVSRILERWATEGKSDGEPGRYSKKTDPKEYERRYGHLTR